MTTINAISVVQPDGSHVEYVPAAERDHYKARAEALLAALRGLRAAAEASWPLVPSGQPEQQWLRDESARAHRYITRINQEDSERA